MFTSIEIKNMTDADLSPIQILLAESDPVEVDRIKSNIEREFSCEMKIAKSYDELLSQIAQEQPQLVILGRIDRSNYLDICKECHKIQAGVQIVLLSTQGIISDSFRQLAKTCGLTDVITKDPTKLNQLLRQLDRPTRQQSTKEPLKPIDRSLQEPKIPGKMMLIGLEEIVTISNNYFGPLAQGNYWRKAHARIVDEFPFVANWSADHFGKIGCNDSILDRELTAEDIQSLRIWVQMFIEECERIIVDFRSILNNSDLSPPAKDLLDMS
jgi:CheY-like chemotaxis protein